MQECISEDLPEPEMPVSTVSRPSGMAASMFLRLFARQPARVRKGWSFVTGAAGAADGVVDDGGEGAVGGRGVQCRVIVEDFLRFLITDD